MFFIQQSECKAHYILQNTSQSSAEDLTQCRTGAGKTIALHDSRHYLNPIRLFHLFQDLRFLISQRPEAQHKQQKEFASPSIRCVGTKAITATTGA